MEGGRERERKIIIWCCWKDINCAVMKKRMRGEEEEGRKNTYGEMVGLV